MTALGSFQEKIWERATRVMPGGVNSPVRAFGAVGGRPRIIERGRGPFVWDVDGRKYIDLVMSWGALIHGHAHPRIIEAARRALEQSSSFGLASAIEVEFAEILVNAFPFIDQVRLVNSGTEATMSAVRLARAVTKRDKIVKFEGCYHGHADSFLVAAGSGALTYGHPSSPGVPEPLSRLTYILPYQDIEALENLFASRGHEIAAVIIEPVAGNMGVIEPDIRFLQNLRNLTSKFGALLIFDEVITGFRTSWGGWSTRTGIRPDLITLGKIIGGGFPLAAYGGAKEIMESVAPIGPVYQAGTLSGNPVAVAAGITALHMLQEMPDYQERLDKNTRYLVNELSSLFTDADIPTHIQAVTGMLTVFFSDKPVKNLRDVKRTNTTMFRTLFPLLLERGVHLPPSPFEGWFLSLSHERDILDQVITHTAEALKALPKYAS